MRKVVVISVDALVSSDLQHLKTLSRSRPLFEHCLTVENVRCVYPTYTYPCHASIMTGCYPDKHGIYHNQPFNEQMDKSEWFWYARDIKVPTMIDVARANGLRTACIAWPVMGGAPADYLIAEIWARTIDDDARPVFQKVDSPLAGKIFDRNRDKLLWMKTPQFDDFAASCAADIIGEDFPDLLFVHLSYLDHQKHVNGPETSKNLIALSFIDEKIGQITDAVRKTGKYGDTIFFIFGDHGHMAIEHKFNINRILMEKGLIHVNPDGLISDWKMMVVSATFSGQVYLNNFTREEASAELDLIAGDYPQYIEALWTREEVKEKYHLDGPFEFVMEARAGVAFDSCLENPVESEPGASEKSAHGFSPEKVPTTFLAAILVYNRM